MTGAARATGTADLGRRAIRTVLRAAPAGGPQHKFDFRYRAFTPERHGGAVRHSLTDLGLRLLERAG